MGSKKIIVHNKSNLPTAKYTDFIELQGDFKERTKEQKNKLEKRILKVGFKYPFVVWKDKEVLHIIDAHSRKIVLSNLENQKYEIPEIPYYEIYAKNIKEAKEEILAFNSEYSFKKENSTFVQEVASALLIETVFIGLSQDNELTLEKIEKFKGSDDDFKEEFEKIKDKDAEYPIVPEFMENYNCFMIVTKNDIDEVFVRNIFDIDKVCFKNDKGLSNRLSNVITIEMLKRALIDKK